MFKRSVLSSARPMATPLTAMLLAAVSIGSNAAHAASVTFDWQQLTGSDPATGTLTLTSSLLTPSNATGATQFSLMLAQIVAAGETVLGDVSAFTFSFGGQTLSTSDMKSNSTGWADMYSGEPNNILESTWSSSHTFSNGTLQVVGNSTPTSYGDKVTATMGTLSATGEWVLPKTQVPLPASIWTLLGGFALLFATTRARWVKPGKPD
ncbi:MAG: hypothetical protein WA803_17770 [Steroidobacteraceae bacterium]